MPRWLTLPAASITILLAFSAYGAPLGTLELNYQPPEPSVTPPPKPVAAPGPVPKAAKPPITWAEAREKNGFRVDIECDHPGCSKPRAKPYPAYEGAVKKTDRRRQSDPYSTNQDPDYNIQLGYEW
ncbi:MAG: hypothetical protein E7J62_08610 [Serratia marcescens]|uniref:hypothetical protein n=1 Tax=Serratia TaxID=613 RepID=UPI000668C4CC|nr:hypothetical protein [Serratia marcescens]SAP50507.1 Uncharacterised protein [Klebsiella oxytoca]AWQ48618.1 hypothetical protein B1A42_15280 [Serratia marcescens]MDU7804688.1 hypothetical protein [Serratia marcescens]BEN40587.1 hypothetical protein SMKC049_23790 [Serratia marcescens]BEO28812.1 hypothetical protein SMQC21_23920 [Serratia marcescens]